MLHLLTIAVVSLEDIKKKKWRVSRYISNYFLQKCNNILCEHFKMCKKVFVNNKYDF